MDQGDTILALSSGRGRAGVAVVRLSGPEARRTIEAVAGPLPAPRRASLRRIVDPDSGEVLDRGLVLWLPGPGSFTGEDMGELQVHGGRAVTAAVVEAVSRLPGVRLAEAGEFTRRALENGHMSLVDAEGLADLINAETEAQRRQAVRQAGGASTRLYESWRTRLIALLAELEAGIDFSDEADVPEDVWRRNVGAIDSLAKEIRGHLADRRRGERLRDGLTVVLAGAANVGKSSLLNRLAQRDAAIVSERAGTTRDAIEVHLDLAGYPVVLVDTAGLREAACDDVEAEGMARTRSRLAAADVVLWVTTAEDPFFGEGAKTSGDAKLLCIVNKIDLVPTASRPDGKGAVLVSALTGEGFDSLMERLTTVADELMGGAESAVISRARHREALESCAGHIERALLAREHGPEFVSADLRLAARSLGILVGRVDVEDVLDAIFSEFCIGK